MEEVIHKELSEEAESIEIVASDKDISETTLQETEPKVSGPKSLHWLTSDALEKKRLDILKKGSPQVENMEVEAPTPSKADEAE